MRLARTVSLGAHAPSIRSLLLAAAGLFESSPAIAQSDVWAVGFDSRRPPTPEYIDGILANAPRPEYFLGPRWSGAQGSPHVVTWSFVPDGVQIPSVIGENPGITNLFARMDAIYAAQGGRATWVQLIQECFDRWEQLTGVEFQRITVLGQDWDDGATWGTAGSLTRGDIRIAMKRFDGSGGVTVIAAFPGNGDILLDRNEGWGDPADLHRLLRNSAMWSQGIAIGVDLSCPQDGTKLMELLIPMGFDGPRQDDLRAGQRHYGDPYEVDDDAGSATSVGTLTIGVPVTVADIPPPATGTNDLNAALLSIDADGESDYYSFAIAAPAVGNVTVAPIGSTYDLGPNSGGNCAGTAPFDALSVADLNVEIIGTDGTTVLGTGAHSPAGSSESLGTVPLNAAGTYYVRVFEGDAPTSPQAYRLTVDITACTDDSDGDGTADCNDGCPLDPDKVAPGACGCGVADDDTDGDGTLDCFDGCALDPDKTAPGQCGCGVADTDSDGDGVSDCNDACPLDPAKLFAGQCGCGVSDIDTDGDGTADCNDLCPNDPTKIHPGQCGCGTLDVDSDGDGTADCNDGCPDDPFKIAPGICGCGVSDADSDGDGVVNCNDGCPNDPYKVDPGVCGCGFPDVDTDGDLVLDCNDGCPADPNKTEPGVCGCGAADVDTDGDGTLDCLDGCPNDPAKVSPGACGCGAADVDTDGDGTLDCFDGCPLDPDKTSPGACGCGIEDVDGDGDTFADCVDNCSAIFNPSQADLDVDGVGDDCDNCPSHFNPDQADCDGDLVGDTCEIASGSELDCDLNGVPDSCQPDCNHNGVADACDILFGTSLDQDGDGVPDDCEAPCPAIQPYCTGKLNSEGCVPAIGWTGVPSASQPTGFVISCTNTIPDRNGQLFYGYAASFAPFQGGNLCVRPPFRRTVVQTSLGTSGCDGSFQFDYNAWIDSGNDAVLTPGLNVFARWWMRDPPAPFTTGFSNALTFTICP